MQHRGAANLPGLLVTPVERPHFMLLGGPGSSLANLLRLEYLPTLVMDGLANLLFRIDPSEAHEAAAFNCRVDRIADWMRASTTLPVRSRTAKTVLFILWGRTTCSVVGCSATWLPGTVGALGGDAHQATLPTVLLGPAVLSLGGGCRF